MAYSFPVFRKGMVFRTSRRVSSAEAQKIATLIKNDFEVYLLAFKSALVKNNGSIIWEDIAEDQTDDGLEVERVRQLSAESYILDLPSLSFRYKGFTVRARNSVTVCRHQHRSKIWTRLSCARFGKYQTELNASELRQFFDFADSNVDAILSGLSRQYMVHLKQAGLPVRKPEAYYFGLRAFNSKSKTCRELLAALQNGLSVTEALAIKKFKPELLDYFEIVFGKKRSPEQIKTSLKLGRVEVFGYKSAEHDALFTAQIDDNQTDLCGYGYDDKDAFKSNVLSHATTKDLLIEYAQNF